MTKTAISLKGHRSALKNAAPNVQSRAIQLRMLLKFSEHLLAQGIGDLDVLIAHVIGYVFNSATGFPPEIITFLSDIGLKSIDINNLHATLLSLDPNQFSGTLFSGLTDLAASLFYASTLRTFIDIKPGEVPNSINPNSRGNIPVAILSMPDFSAPVKIRTTSLTFGRTGDEPSLASCNTRGEDVNGDGLLDLVCHFDTQKTAFKSGDTIGILKGEDLSGTSFISTDSVRIVPSSLTVGRL